MPTLRKSDHDQTAVGNAGEDNDLSLVLTHLQILTAKFDRIESRIDTGFRDLLQSHSNVKLCPTSARGSALSRGAISKVIALDDTDDRSPSCAANGANSLIIGMTASTSIMKKSTNVSSGKKSAASFGKTSTMLHAFDEDEDGEADHQSSQSAPYEDRYQRLNMHEVLKGYVSTERVTRLLSDNQIQRWRGSTISTGVRISGYYIQTITGHDSQGHNFVSRSCVRVRRIFPLSPDSRIKLFFDIVSMFMLLNDSIMVPFMIAWEKKLEGFFWINSWFTVVFWSVDILLHFCTCVTENDVMTKSWARIASHYVRGWFPVDLCVVAFDWISIVVEIATGGDTGTPVWVKMVRLLKASRMLRILEMIKSGRFAQVSEMIIQKARAKGIGANVYVMLRMCKMVVLILWMSHVGSCLWYGALMNNITWSDTCLDWNMNIVGRFAEEDSCSVLGSGEYLSERFYYLTGLYWSVTAMFSGASFLVPSNSSEAIFAIAFVIFGMLFSSCIVSSLAATLIDFEMMMRESTIKMRTLQNFLHQHKIHPLLCVNVQRQIRTRLMVEKRITETDVVVMSLLSTELRTQLRSNLCTPFISTHPIVGICYLLHEPFIRNMCDRCISHEATSPGTILFKEGAKIRDCWLLVTGAMQYKLGNGRDAKTTHSSSEATLPLGSTEFSPHRESSVPSESAEIMEVRDVHWVCEIAMWSLWVSVGSIEATDACELLKIDVKLFADVVVQSSVVFMVMQDYGAALIEFLQTEKPTDFNDMQLGIDHDLIVALMDDRSRVAVSQPALESLKAKAEASFQGRAHARKGLEELQKEVDSGACHLRAEEGKLLRIAQVVAVRVFRQDDGRMLVQLGEWKDGKAISGIKLPGSKMRCADGAEKTVHRVLAGVEMTEFAIHDSICFDYQEVEFSRSEAYNIQTKYVRTVYSASLRAGMDTAECSMTFYHNEAEIETFLITGSSHVDDLKIVNFKFWAWIHPDDLSSIRNLEKSQQPVLQWMEEFRAQFAKPSMSASNSRAQRTSPGTSMALGSRSINSKTTHERSLTPSRKSDEQADIDGELADVASKPLGWDGELLDS